MHPGRGASGVSSTATYQPAKPPACYCFAGGGTGGHLMPGLALAAELMSRDPGSRIVFIGSDRPFERTLIADNGYDHVALPVESSRTMRRNPLKFLWKNWRSYCAALHVLKQEQPCAVIGLGGYASVPLVYAGTGHGVPALILEQNVTPGRATRWLSRRADAVCISFAATAPLLSRSRRIELCGNPVRRAILSVGARHGDPNHRSTPTLLVLGGSQGAVPLNEALLHLIERERAAFQDWHIVHQTGRDHVAAVRSAYGRLGVPHSVEPFFNDLPERYREATLVLSRAGATTLAELACAGCPAILVPYPHAADNHQLRNAEACAAAGAACIAQQGPDPATTAQRLATAALPLMRDPIARDAMSKAMLATARPDATERVLDVLESVLKTTRSA